MSAVAISSLTTSTALRAAVQQIQTKLTQAQTELSTGRAADVGLSLGGRTAQAASLHQVRARLDVFAQSNALATTRLKATDAALTTVADTVKSLQAQVIAGQGGTTTPTALATAAKGGLADAIATLNTSFDGNHLFGGVNTDVRPFADDGAAGAQAVTDAFTATFGMAPTDPAASTITPAAMQTFLDGPFAALFSGSAWGSNWSSASNAAITSRVSPTQVLTTSVTANDAALRGSVQAMSALADLGLPNLSADTRAVVMSQASGLLGKATSNVASLQANVGLMQNTVTGATDDVTRTGQFIDAQIGNLEDVDPAEVSTRISSLTTQLESAYSLTGKLSQLSLVKYLP